MSNKRPIIGITASIDAKASECQTLYRSYSDAIYAAGGLAMMLTIPDLTLRDSFDEIAAGSISAIQGLLLSGGDDMDAWLFGEENIRCNGSFVEERDHFEIALTKAALQSGVPIFGICRGLQILNVAAQGSIYQDIVVQANAQVMHSQKAAGSSYIHKISLTAESLLGKTLLSPELLSAGACQIRVNSFHHQAVNRVADGFQVAATASDGIIEAIEIIPEKNPQAHPFTLGVQWHPERLWKRDDPSRRLMNEFVRISSGR